MPPTPRIDVVVVTWNHNSALERCLAALAASDRETFEFHRIVVVDNASAPPCRVTSRPPLPPVTLLTNTDNLGFAVACNQGAADSRADYILFLNPDTEISPTAIASAIRHLEDSAAASTAIVGLPLEDRAAVRQATCGRFPSATNVFTQTSGLSRLAPRRFTGMRMTDWDHRDTRLVDYVSGACLFVRRPVFEQLGGFDERLTVYLEDADLSLRARHLSLSTCFVATGSVMHIGGWSTGRNRSLRLAHAWRSLLTYGWKHLGWFDAGLVTLTVLVVAPAARLGQAVMHRSGKEVLAACAGYARFWRLVTRDLVGSTRQA